METLIMIPGVGGHQLHKMWKQLDKFKTW